MSRCIECKKELIPLEENLTRKLINRGTTKFLCKKCLAERFSVTEQDLDKMVEDFKRQGCSLFL